MPPQDHDLSSHGGGTTKGASTNTTSGLTSLIPQELEPSAADNLRTLVQECGVSPHRVSELLQELPPVRSSDVLIDYYFNSV